MIVTPMVLAAVLGVLGLAVGSFLNVVVHRVPLGLSVVRPASACPSCQTPIRPRDNIPVLGWVLLRGRCRTCGARIGVRYPAIELLTGLLFAASALRYADLELAVFVAATAAVLIALAFIDLEHRRVPNVIVLPATGVALLWVAVSAAVRGDPGILVAALASAAGGFLVMFLLAVLSGGLGFGDVKLTAFIGIVVGRLGWEAFLLALFSGFVAGGLVASALLLLGRTGRKDAIPFAPMLCIGALVGLFWGTEPVRRWLGF